MMDAGSGGGIGKAAQELMQEMQRAQQELQSKTAKAPGGEGFQQALQNTQAAQAAASVQQVSPTQQASNVLLQAKVNHLTPATRVGEAAKAERSKMAALLESLVGGQDKMTKIMNLALSGKKFDTQELLVMQAGVYRFSQELDLTGKVIEKATSGVKQTMNTQV